MVVLSVLFMLLILSTDALVKQLYKMELEGVQAQTTMDIKQQVAINRNEIEELKLNTIRMAAAQERQMGLMVAMQIDMAEFKAKFSVLYAILACIGAAVVVPIIQRYAGERRK